MAALGNQDPVCHYQFCFCDRFRHSNSGRQPPNPASFKYFGIAIILWYILGLYYLIYNQLSRDYLLQAYLQIFSDIVIITAILHLTGDLESNYLSLYLVVIILSSIAASARAGFPGGGGKFCLHGRDAGIGVSSDYTSRLWRPIIRPFAIS